MDDGRPVTEDATATAAAVATTASADGDVLATAPPRLRRSLAVVTAAWGFGAAWMYIASGATMTRYAKTLQMSEFGFGLLAAIPFAGAVFQLPASYYLEKHGHRKRLFLIAGMLHRAMWLVIAAIPWIAPADDWWWLLLVVMSGSTVLANLQSPAWVVWMADLVPMRIRGRYFSRRTQIGQLVGLITTIAVGFSLDAAESVDADTLRRVISGLLLVAAVCGMLDIAMFRWVPDDRVRHHDDTFSFRAMVGRAMGDRNFRLLLGYTFTLTFAVGYVGQFIWLYLFDVVQMTNLQANLMLVALPLVVSMSCYPLWGRAVDRLGCKPVLVIAGLIIVQGGSAWVWVTKESWYFGYAASLMASAAWPGVELGTTNLLIRISTQQGAHSRGASAYVAMHSLMVAIAGTLSGLFGGVIASQLRDFHGTLFGWPITYHGVLLIISSALRFAALFWLIHLVDPGAVSTRTALAYMTTNIYSNVKQAVFIPGGGIVRLGRFVYRVIPVVGRGRKTGKQESRK